MQQCLTLSKQIAEIAISIDEVLLLLKSKRTTVEEKMIAKYFHELMERYARTLASLHGALGAADDKVLPAEDVRFDLHALNLETKSTVDELLKIARYNFNFLEQYFEHDYFESLVEKHKFIELLDALLKRFSLRRSSDWN